MQVEPQNPNISFPAETEVGTSSSPRRWSLATVPTASDIMRKRVLNYTKSKPTQKMVIEAIQNIGSMEDKGASVTAITKWIVGNYAILDIDRVKIEIKKAIVKALEQGTIQRSATSRGALGASGSFVMGGKKLNSRPPAKKVKSAKSASSKQNEEPEE